MAKFRWCALVAFALVGCRADDDGESVRVAIVPAADVATAPDAAVGSHRAGGYATSDACVTCHADTHASWTRSFHRTMTQRPSAVAIRGRFDGAPLDTQGNYVAYRDGERFMVRMPTAQGSTQRPIALVTGSHHMQVYWTRDPGGTLVAFAFAYLLPEARWVPNEWTLLRPPSEMSAQRGEVVEAVYTWNRVCVKCHAVDGVPGFDASAGAVRTTAAELGIACEACHGPGQEHVDMRTQREAVAVAGDDSDAEPHDDPTIVDPRELGAAGSSEICGQCHSISVFADDAAWVAHGRDAPPPAPMADWGTLVAHPLREPEPAEGERALSDALLDDDPDFFAQRFWSDGQVRVSGREYNGIVESPCFASGDFGCLTCHRMHESGAEVDGMPWVDGQLRDGVRDDGVCARCHVEISADPSAHTHHAPTSSGSACSNCHLAHTTYGLLGAIRSHEITSPRMDVARTTGRPIACNLCHLERSLAWSDGWLTRWWDHAATEDLAGAAGEGPAVARWLVAGDAGQRALAAWHLGWSDALAVGRPAWSAALLAETVASDPYPAVRLVAERALRASEARDRSGGPHGLDPAWLESLREHRDERAVRLAE